MASPLTLCGMFSQGRKIFFPIYTSLEINLSNLSQCNSVTACMFQTFSKLKVRKPNIHLQASSHHRYKVNGHQVFVEHSRSLSKFSKNKTLEKAEEVRQKKSSRLNSMRRDRLAAVEIFNNFQQEKGENAEWSGKDWMELSEQLKTQMTGSWEMMCMHTLMLESNATLGRSLMKYLEAWDEPISPVITTFYIGLLGKTSGGDEKQEEEVKSYYDHLASVTDIFDAASIEVLAEGLSNTKYYKECINLFEISKLTSPPGLSLLRNILLAAIRYQDKELCSMALQFFETDLEPSQLLACATAIIDTAVETNNSEGLQMFFDFMQKHGLSLLREQLHEVLETFQRVELGEWHGSFGFVNHRSGKCSMCGVPFNRLLVSDEEFQDIQSAFLDQVIVSDNIFYKTSPAEVNNFIKFVEKFGPFDVVIDGMNAVHARSSKNQDGEILERLVSKYCKENKRVLVLGSKVLRQYTQKLFRYKPKPVVYMTSTTRADDSFFLYAALHSGKDTLIVTADKLRDHKFKLEPHLRSTFHRWLMSVQVYHYTNIKNNVIQPKQQLYDLGPMKDENGWHIPENDTDINWSFGRQGILCLRNGKENFTPTKLESNKLHRKPKHEDKEWFEL